MDITRKTDYALRMLAELVRHPGEVLSVRIAAEENGVPYSFARSIQHDLVRAGLIESVRGSRGGMRLAVDPDETTLLAVIEAVQGEVLASDCDSVGDDNGLCPRMPSCPFNPVFCGASTLLRDYYASVALSDIVFGRKAPSIPERYWSEHAFDFLVSAEEE